MFLDSYKEQCYHIYSGQEVGDFYPDITAGLRKMWDQVGTSDDRD